VGGEWKNVGFRSSCAPSAAGLEYRHNIKKP